MGTTMSGALEQFPLLMVALKEELKRELLEELGRCQWLDQEHSVLGRNKHVRACRRLIREGSPDVIYDDGKWLLRASALDAEIVRANRSMVERGKLPESEPPAALVEPVRPTPKLPPMTLAKALPEHEPEDDTGIYASGWLDRMRGSK
jgi:hypothetical protein